MEFSIIHTRNPDGECTHTLYVDGVRVPADSVSVEDIDPGRGYEQEDYEERLAEARTEADQPDANDFDRDVAEELASSEWLFRRFSTGRWETREEKSDG